MRVLLNKNCNHESLTKNGFQKYGSKYILNIPLYKYKKITVIELRFIITIEDNCREIEKEVIDCTTNDSYIPFYNPEYPGVKNNLVLKRVKSKYTKEIKKLISNDILSEDKI